METKVTSEQVELIDIALYLLTHVDDGNWKQSDEWLEEANQWVARCEAFQASLTDGSMDEVEF